VVAPPTDLYYRLFRPFIWLLNSAANATLSLFGLRATTGRHVHSAEEIRLLVTESQKAGSVEEEEAILVLRAFKFVDRVTKEVMVPRTAVAAIPKDLVILDAIAVVRQAGYTRLPVFEADLDHIVGMVHVRDLLFAQMDGRQQEPVAAVMRPALHVPGTKPVADLLDEMRRLKTQLAVVLDEYGGTAGIATLEDLLEELVGEIPGEFRAEPRRIVFQRPDLAMVDASVALDELNEALGVSLPVAEANTLGGFIFRQVGTIPHAGMTVRYKRLEFKIETVTGNRIGLVEVRKL